MCPLFVCKTKLRLFPKFFKLFTLFFGIVAQFQKTMKTTGTKLPNFSELQGLLPGVVTIEFTELAEFSTPEIAAALAELAQVQYPGCTLAQSYKQHTAAPPTPPTPPTPPPTYGDRRLKELGISHRDFILPNKTGGIDIFYRYIDGKPVRYIVNGTHTVKTFCRTRLAPPQALQYGCKYTQPKKDVSGISTMPFFPAEVLEAFKNGYKVKTIVFTEGELKAVTACKNGVLTVSFAGNTVYQLCKQIEQLLQVLQPDNVVINYDADANDQARSDDRKANFFNSAYNFTRQLIDYQTETGRQFNIYLNMATGKAGKGLDDNFINEPATVAEFKTLESGNYFIFEKINKYNFVSLYECTFGGWRDHRHIDGVVLTGKPGEKLNDILTRYNISMAGKAMAVPTGGGKTFAGNQFADAGNKMVFAVPTLALANNVASEYGMAIFTGAQKEDIRGAEKIVTTFSSLPSVCKVINPEFYHLFIDEAHNTGAGFMYSTMQKVVALLPQFRSITTLTGTPQPEFIPTLAALPKVTVTMPQQAKRFYRYNAKDTLKAAAVAVQNSIAKGRFPVVLLNDTNAGGKLGAMEVLLKTAGIKYATFNSYKKQDADFLSITKNGIIPGDIQAIVTTTVLKEGNNIYNNVPFDYIIIGNFHVNEVHQLSERSRNSTDTAVFWLRAEKVEQSKAKPNAYKLGAMFTDAANKAIQELNLQAKDDEPEAVIVAEAQARGAIGALPIKRNELGQYELDPVRLNSMVFDAERNALCRNEAWYFKRLQAFGFTIETGTATDGAPPPPAKIVAERTQAETEAIKEHHTEAKAVEAKEVEQVLPQLLEYGAVRIEAILQERRNDLTKTEQVLYKHFIKLCKYCTEAKAVEHLQAIGLSKSKFKALYNRMGHQFLRHNESYQRNAGSLVIAVMALYNKFEVGKSYTSAELQAGLLACLDLDAGLNTYKHKHEAQRQRHDQTLKTLRYFFELETAVQRHGNELVKAYKLGGIDKAALFGTDVEPALFGTEEPVFEEAPF